MTRQDKRMAQVAVKLSWGRPSDQAQWLIVSLPWWMTAHSPLTLWPSCRPHREVNHDLLLSPISLIVTLAKDLYVQSIYALTILQIIADL